VRRCMKQCTRHDRYLPGMSGPVPGAGEVLVNRMVSIIVPLYNSQELIRDTLESLLAQTYRPFEVVLVDDGSTDGTAGVAAGYVTAHDNVRYLYKRNGGVGSARNYGIRHAAGDFIALCDHDDLWARTKLERQMELFADPAVGMVYTGGEPLDDFAGGAIDRLFAPYVTREKVYHEGKCYYQLLQYNCIPACSAVIRKQVLDQVGPFNESREMHGVDDKHMWLRIAHDFELRAVREILVRNRITGNNWSLYEDKMLRSAIACLDDITRVFPEADARGMLLVTNAYRLVYQHFGKNFFNDHEYAAARGCFRHALRLKGANLEAAVYYLSTFLPEGMIAMLRSFKRFSGRR